MAATVVVTLSLNPSPSDRVGKFSEGRCSGELVWTILNILSKLAKLGRVVNTMISVKIATGARNILLMRVAAGAGNIKASFSSLPRLKRNDITNDGSDAWVSSRGVAFFADVECVTSYLGCNAFHPLLNPQVSGLVMLMLHSAQGQIIE